MTLMLYLGDCLEVMKELSDNSVDSVVTDPPYGLGFMGKEWDKLQRKVWRGGNKYPDGADKFTGTRPAYIGGTEVQEWHYQWAKECLRVLKPGGHLLSFGGTRTYHRMACAVEDAGFEIRDCIFWVYGSGFPKSLNVAFQYEQELCERVTEIDPRTQKKVTKWRYKDNGTEMKRVPPFRSLEANEWEGWGTALKPAVEPIVLARKPLSEKNVAENVLKWGTGGLNIDGCRVAFGDSPEEQHTKDQYDRQAKSGVRYFNQEGTAVTFKYNQTAPQGRFPANLIHDGSEEVVGMFPNTKSNSGAPFNRHKNTIGAVNINCGEANGVSFYGDEGSAARFFYCSKASRAERNMGLEEMEAKSAPNPNYGKGGFSRPTGQPEREIGKQQNNHPTVKPISLMRYLCRLITPPNGIVLDPFMGSGSTGIAAKMEEFDFIGIEKDEEYFKIAERRISNGLLF